MTRSCWGRSRQGEGGSPDRGVRRRAVSSGFSGRAVRHGFRRSDRVNPMSHPAPVRAIVFSLLSTSLLLGCAPRDEVGVEGVDGVDQEITSHGVYVLRAVHSGKCVDVTGASTLAGAN